VSEFAVAVAEFGMLMFGKGRIGSDMKIGVCVLDGYVYCTSVEGESLGEYERRRK
jgi:hypothetical protein